MMKFKTKNSKAENPKTENQIPLSEIYAELGAIDDETWGRYAFSRDILKDRISEEKKREMIEKSIQCGKEYANRIQDETGKHLPREIAEDLKIRVTDVQAPAMEKRVLFAQFTSPDQIEIFCNPIGTYKEVLYAMPAEEAIRMPMETVLYDVLLGHEIFHFLEDRDEAEIYTRTEKIQLWRFLGLQNNSTVRALGEIAAMAFTKELNHTAFSPFSLDILLTYGYNADLSKQLYKEITGFLQKNDPSSDSL